MGWLLLAGLGIIWVAFLLPTRRGSPNRSIEDFERRMELLADTDGNGRGRWIVTPRKGMAFVGTRERARERARERRRRVFVFMLESIALAFLIGLVPPLRAMWFAAGVLLILLAVYVWLLVSMKDQAAVAPRVYEAAPEATRPARRSSPARAADGAARHPSNSNSALEADDLVNIVVRPARQRVGVAGV
jgi:hypothetical protein